MYVFISLMQIPGVDFLSHDNYMFNYLRKCQTVFQSGYTSLYSHQQCMKIPISPHPCQHLLFSVFLIVAVFSTSSALPRGMRKLSGFILTLQSCDWVMPLIPHPFVHPLTYSLISSTFYREFLRTM